MHIMIKNILEMLEVVKDDTSNLGKLSKIALGKNKLPMSFKEGIKLLKYKK
jgi:hypothetical protein